MRQALHIFKKDVRYLRWEIIVLQLVLVLWMSTETWHAVSFPDIWAPPLLLVCMWALFCARLIQAEAIPGDRQFWITRPYDWRSLLAAKMLFIAAFVSAPFLFAEAATLGLTGFSIAKSIPALLCSVAFVTIVPILLFCALASLTRGLVQWTLCVFLPVGGLTTLNDVVNRNAIGSQWIGYSVMIAVLAPVCAAVLLWQYKRRQTLASGVAMGAGMVAVVLITNDLHSADLQLRLLKPKVDPSPIQLALHPVSRRAPRAPGDLTWTTTHDWVWLAFPIDVSGLPEGTDVFSDRVRIDFSDEGSQMRFSHADVAQSLEHGNQGYRQIVMVDRRFYESAKNRLTRLKFTYDLTLLGNRSSTLLHANDRRVPVPGVGLCSALGRGLVESIDCVSALRDPANILTVKLGQEEPVRFFIRTSYSPLPADPLINPLRRFSHGGGQPAYDHATLINLEPLAHFRRDLELRDVHLSDYTR